jgi:hypothetical protein
VVPFQEVKRILAVSADDADPADYAESHPLAEREEDFGEFVLLGGHLYGAEFAL